MKDARPLPTLASSIWSARHDARHALTPNQGATGQRSEGACNEAVSGFATREHCKQVCVRSMCGGGLVGGTSILAPPGPLPSAAALFSKNLY